MRTISTLLIYLARRLRRPAELTIRSCFSLSSVTLLSLAAVVPLSAQAAELIIRNHTANEYQQVANIAVELSEPVTEKVVVHVSTAANTATPGRDFYGVYEVIEFEPGQVKKVVRIPILNDTEMEEKENFTATIWGAEGATITKAVSWIVINDDDSDGIEIPVINLTSIEVAENSGTVTVPLVLSNPAPRAVSFIFATSGDTATPGSDFYGMSEKVRFASGEIAKSVTIKLVDDDVTESNERINLNLYNVVGAAIGEATGTITLLDDDGDNPVNGLAVKAHVLNRLGYGASAASLAQINRLGVDGYIEAQLSSDLAAPICDKCNEAAMTAAKLTRSLQSQSQLAEVLVDFWFNHFNVDTVNSIVRNNLGRYEGNYIRQNVFGQFEDMLVAVAKSPAMLTYLDNRSSTKEGLVIGGRERGLNENYARELMELHTLGVNGGYSEEDVITVARVLTGWRIKRVDTGEEPYVFEFRASYHDTEPKNFMNGTLVIAADEGIVEGEKLLRILARHPKTASFVSRKLIQRFVAETPPEALVAAAADTWLSTDGNLREVMRTILTSTEFLDPGNFGTKIKSPLHLLVSASRVMNVSAIPDTFRGMLIAQGQDMYKVPPPTGVPENTPFWISSATMLARFDSMKAIAGDQAIRDGVVISDGDADAIVSEAINVLMPQGASDATKDEVVKHLQAMAPDATFDERKNKALTLLLSSPEFMRH